MSADARRGSSQMESAGRAKMSGKTPTLDLSTATQLPDCTTCLACSEDGRYLCVGHYGGLSVWCASSLECVAKWLQDALEITYIQITMMAEETYLTGTIDDMGVARVFAYHNGAIHLLSVINIMENINKRSICLTFELSEGGDYGAASISCDGALWLEVYHFPTEAWLKELETALSQKQEPNLSDEVDVKWSPVDVLLKINPPESPAGKALEEPLDAFSMTDVLTHLLTFNGDSSGKIGERNESPRHCIHHFLLPCGQSPVDSNAKPAGLPVAVCLWWSGSSNLLHYSLRQPQTKKTETDRPNVFWPNAKEILCSAVSKSTRYIAVGLGGALVCVWDRLTGASLSVISVSETDSAFYKMQFVGDCSVAADDSQTIHLLLLCKSGTTYHIATGRGTQSCTMQLTERPKDSRDVPVITASVPFLPSLTLMMCRNGKMSLQDVCNKSTICFLVPPTTHLISTPCSPVYAFNSKLHTLFVQGEQEGSGSDYSEGGRNSQLLIFRFGQSDIFKQCMTASSLLQNPKMYASLEKSCNFYLQQRAVSAHERNKALEKTWKQLQESAVMVTQRAADG